MIKRFDRLDVLTSDLADAISTYQKNFDFSVRRTAEPGEATIAVGDAQIRLRSGAAVAGLISSSGEGLGAIWLEADDLEQVAQALQKAGIAASPVRIEGERRIIEVDPKSTNMVPLFIFDRK
jgi:predicted enzyme related to lactoylglutathione lyase